ncbi:hypothetical protein [Natronococcus wangiae]|uniref:hypothetical protein n=1 Tax=Natronococcus wangiae TaxID=3068275 RepID=UPI00273F55ED|nr:hypothetical protein [Natronococcus sp. AD5]
MIRERPAFGSFASSSPDRIPSDGRRKAVAVLGSSRRAPATEGRTGTPNRRLEPAVGWSS